MAVPFVQAGKKETTETKEDASGNSKSKLIEKMKKEIADLSERKNLVEKRVDAIYWHDEPYNEKIQSAQERIAKIKEDPGYRYRPRAVEIVEANEETIKHNQRYTTSSKDLEELNEEASSLSGQIVSKRKALKALEEKNQRESKAPSSRNEDSERDE